MNAATIPAPSPRMPVVDQVFGANKAPMVDVLQADFADMIKAIDELIAEADGLPVRIDSEDDQIAVGGYIAKARAFAKRADSLRAEEKRPILDATRALDGFFGGHIGRIEESIRPLQRAADDFARRVAAEARAKAEREEREAREAAERERQKAEAAKSATAAGNAEARAEALDAKADRAAEVATASTADLARVRGQGVTVSAKDVWAATIEDYAAAVSPLGAIGPYFKREALEAALLSMVRIQKAGAVWPGVRFHVETKTTFRR